MLYSYWLISLFGAIALPGFQTLSGPIARILAPVGAALPGF